jgi:glycosyltransferase involved in cell wall biosynthesis
MLTLQVGLEWFRDRAGGLSRYYADLIASLKRVGEPLYGLVVGSASAAEDTNGDVVAFAPFQARPLTKLLHSRRAISQLLAEHKFALVASHFPYHIVSSLDLIRVPIVSHFHGPWAYESAAEGGGRVAFSVKKDIERIVLRRSAKVITLSEAFKQVVVERYGVGPGCVEVIPGGIFIDSVSLTVDRRAAREGLRWPTDRPILLSTRRLVHRMGLINLVEAARRLSESHPELLTMIVGEGPVAPHLRAAIEELGLESRVRLVGFLPDAELDMAYRAADLCIVPSVALEGFGLVCLESLVRGTPVLVTPTGGLPEVVRDLDPRLVLPDSTPGALAEGIGWALDNLQLLPTAQQCEQYVGDRFSWEMVTSRILDVYRSVA